MGYVYVQSEKAGAGGAENDLFTVGAFAPDGAWFPDSDYATKDEAVKRVAYLNGKDDDLIERHAKLLKHAEAMHEELVKTDRYFPVGFAYRTNFPKE